jgi:hypothetical protein
MTSKIAGTLLVFAALSGTASAQQAAGVFSQGRAHFIVTAGTGYAFDESYFVLGLGGSYYLVDGLSAGLFAESWSGSDPTLIKITPSLQYVFHQVPTVKPYIGAFYRRTEIDGLADLDSVGGRVGAYLQASRNAYLGAGVVYESYLDCSASTYRKCDSTYGELSVTFAF